MNNLNIKQESFAQAYVRLGIGSDAYRSSKYSHKNKTDKSIHEAASRLLNNSKVQARIKELQSQVAEIAKEKLKIDSLTILNHLNILRQARIDEYVEFVEYDFPIITTTTTGTGKKAITTTITSYEKRKELRFKPFDELTEQQLMCIESIKQNRYGEIELKLHGKEWTIEKINKHIGFYAKDNEQKSPVITNNIDMSKLSDQALEELEKASSNQDDEENE